LGDLGGGAIAQNLIQVADRECFTGYLCHQLLYHIKVESDGSMDPCRELAPRFKTLLALEYPALWFSGALPRLIPLLIRLRDSVKGKAAAADAIQLGLS
jgi:hypothetical protein